MSHVAGDVVPLPPIFKEKEVAEIRALARAMIQEELKAITGLGSPEQMKKNVWKNRLKIGGIFLGGVATTVGVRWAYNKITNKDTVKQIEAAPGRDVVPLPVRPPQMAGSFRAQA